MRPLDVMLVDDDDADLFLHSLVLRDCDQVREVTAFQDPAQSLQFLRDNPHRVDVLFLDINMPAMDGFAFLEEYSCIVREHLVQRQVVMLTSSVNPADRARAWAADVTITYLEKPLDAESLRRVLQAAPDADDALVAG